MFYTTKYRTILLNCLVYYNGRKELGIWGSNSDIIGYVNISGTSILWDIWTTWPWKSSWTLALYGSTVQIIIIWYGTIGILIKQPTKLKDIYRLSPKKIRNEENNSFNGGLKGLNILGRTHTPKNRWWISITYL